MGFTDKNVVVELRNIGDRVVDNARKVMHAAANRIVKQARRNAPVDDGQLEKSIHIEKAYGDRGRLEINVVAGGEVDGVNVDLYAAKMHESEYKLGPASRAKAAAGNQVGPKFLERAAEDEEARLEDYMIEAITEVTE